MISLVAISTGSAVVGGVALADSTSGADVLSVAIVTATGAVVVALIGAVVTVLSNRSKADSQEALTAALTSAQERAERAERELDRERRRHEK